MINSESARPTHVQHYSRLSYDKMLNYIDELEKKGMIFRGGGGLISITNKGREFTQQYSQLINLIESAGL
jgi:predicted transcriptional regulator